MKEKPAEAGPIEARWARPLGGERVLCLLCPHSCRMAEGEQGLCQVRQNLGGRLRSLSYAHPTGFAVDPIEKKPLFHFLPGSKILSFGTLGCTLGCKFCQNWPHSHPDGIDLRERPIAPEEVVALAEGRGVPSIAYTYNEPTVFAEYMVEVARLARAKGLRNVAVTNGYITAHARREVFADLDAANVDLKGFSDDFYREQTGGRLRYVLDTLQWMRRETQIWLEITTLLIPGLNDAEALLQAECDWIVGNLGGDVPLHFTAFHPDFQMLDRPRTPPDTLRRARDIARVKGIRHVYVGNVTDDEGLATHCPQCAALLISRSWQSGSVVGLENARCRECGLPLAGVF
jgi:pyruvate formate lyase activating enzyme